MPTVVIARSLAGAPARGDVERVPPIAGDARERIDDDRQRAPKLPLPDVDELVPEDPVVHRLVRQDHAAERDRAEPQPAMQRAEPAVAGEHQYSIAQRRSHGHRRAECRTDERAGQRPHEAESAQRGLHARRSEIVTRAPSIVTSALPSGAATAPRIDETASVS